MKYNLISMLFLSVISLSAFAQEVMGPNGQSDTTGSIQVDWNVGEMIIETTTLNAGIATNGFEQPHFVVSSIEKINPDNLIQVQVFPNPVTESLNIEFSEPLDEEYSIVLYDVNGRIVREHSTSDQNTQMKVIDLPASTYYLTLQSSSGKHVEKFSLIKSH